MRVLLLSAPQYHAGKFGRKFFVPYSPPIGLASISVVLSKAGHDVDCVDMLRWPPENVRAKILEYRPDIVGITCLTEQRAGVFQLATLAKELCPNSKVVLGGPHPTIMWQQTLLHNPAVDIVVMGEGEKTMVELVNALARREDIGHVQGIAFKRRTSLRSVATISVDWHEKPPAPEQPCPAEVPQTVGDTACENGPGRTPSAEAGAARDKAGQVGKPALHKDGTAARPGADCDIFVRGELAVANDPRPMIEDLDTLPFPDYSFFDLDSYRPYQPRGYKSLKYAPINSSRGCVARCQFCSVPLFWGGRWRGRSARNVVDEMSLLHRQGRRFFNFTDDLFSVSPRRVIQISNEILARGLGIRWDFETRPSFVTEEMLSAAARAGCVMIAYGVESGSERILEGINKKVSCSQIVEAFAATKAHRIRAHALLMVGNPGESEKTVAETCMLLREIRPDSVAVQLATVYPGSPLYEQAKSVGFISDEYWLSAPFYTVERNLATLKRWQDRILAESDRGFSRVTRKVQLLISRTLGIRISKEGVTRENVGDR